jgi:hypothetical protein
VLVGSPVVHRIHKHVQAFDPVILDDLYFALCHGDFLSAIKMTKKYPINAIYDYFRHCLEAGQEELLPLKNHGLA